MRGAGVGRDILGTARGGGGVTVLLAIVEVKTILILQRNSDLIGLNWKIGFNQI